MFAASLIVIAGLTAYAALWIVGRQNGVFDSATPAAVHSRPTSPLDEAERILAHRYAKGEITAEEYNRMLAILRR